MTRIELDGEGQPIPIHALPAFATSEDVAPTTLVFTEDTEFPVAMYRDLGFTHFEATVVGGAGGYGGHGTTGYAKAFVSENRQVSQDIWNLVRQQGQIADYNSSPWSNQPGPDDQYFWDWRLWGGWVRPSVNGQWMIRYPAPAVFYPAEWNKRYTGLDSTFYQPARPSGIPPFPSPNHAYYDLPHDPTYFRAWDILGGLGLVDFNTYQLKEGLSTSWDFTWLEAFDFKYNTAAEKTRLYQTLTAVALIQSIQQGRIGGAGGGGGMHKVAGSLADLGETVSIGVGKAGEDGTWGQVKELGDDTPTMAELWMNTSPDPLPYPGGSGAYPEGSTEWRANRSVEISNYWKANLYTYPLPHPSFPNPGSGSDGEPSYFGDLAKASGGKAGSPGMVWNPDTSKFESQGWGGDGGKGGRLEAGGGGAGSKVQGTNGGDGTWSPVTGIGAGGGGGKAGLPSVASGGGGYGSPWWGGYSQVTYTHYPPSSGGRGAYSALDVDKHGARGVRRPISYTQYLEAHGSLVPTQKVEASPGSAPGGGGGARPLPHLKVGSHASGYSPNGVVVLRLVKIVE